MRRSLGRLGKLAVGVVVSAVFLWLALREVQVRDVWLALRQGEYLWFLPALSVMFASHYVRAYRHRYLLLPVGNLPTPQLFSALMIGYMANTLLPAHLGELVRAYVVGRRGKIPASSALATIAVERILDVLTLLLLMAAALLVFPFPSWVRISGALTLLATLALAFFLLWMRRQEERATGLVRRNVGRVSARLASSLAGLLHSFVQGLAPLQRRRHYALVAISSALVWAGYAAVIRVLFRAYGLDAHFALGLKATVVTLVITTIAVVVPSSPGYVGTYHWLCMKSLELFAVPPEMALSYAVALHALNMLPVAGLGLVFAWKEGYSPSHLPNGRQAQIAST
ncbi:MAG: flippase-like domain-containing protein [candidate division KSB1 bacterium]|nr:flippase-like domain-containing protein [candidate division KSB1 bacterium]